MTLGYSVSMASNRIQSGEVDEIWTPHTPRRNTCGVIMLHGSGNPQGFTDSINQPSSVKLAAALARYGIPCIAGDMAFEAWGNDAVVSRIDAAWTVLKTQFPKMRTDKVCLLGISMGGAAVARWSQANPTKTACVLGLIPLFDLTSFYAYPAYSGAVQNAIGTAWGVTAPAALPARANILSTASSAAGIPHLIGYSSVDTTVLPPWSTNYGTAVGATMMITDSTYGHSDQAVGGMPITTATNFLVAHGA
jgi:pimeloyl-ACP methyl ester carboxylesterase